MSLSDTDQLGQLLADGTRRDDELAQNISPDDETGLYQVQHSASIALQGTVTITAHYLSATAFVLDHPVYGELNSPTLYINGGYAGTVGASFGFPVAFPITFSGGTAGSEVLFTKSF